MKHRIQISVLGLLLASNVMAASNEASTVSEAALSPDSTPQLVSAEVQKVVNWVMESGDNEKLPFLLVDKVNAKVYVFNAAGQLHGSAAALLGMARGDHSIPGIGSRPLSQIAMQDRVTPAGRFVSSLSYDKSGKQILVIDYEEALSLHPVVKGTPAERRAERLQSSTPQDNRISFGCINVPVQFFKTIVSPAFTRSDGIVYILPEMSPSETLFGASKLKNTLSSTNR